MYRWLKEKFYFDLDLIFFEQTGNFPVSYFSSFFLGKNVFYFYTYRLSLPASFHAYLFSDFFHFILLSFQLKKISKIRMISLVDTLPIVQLSTSIPLRQLLPKNDVTINDNDKSIDQLSDRYGQSQVIHGDGRRAVLVLAEMIILFSYLF
jgi:hypothetical protein